MASDLLHIKDSYYFDVPRMFWRVNYESSEQLADQVGDWVVRNDEDYQEWEADLAIERLASIVADKAALAHAKESWKAWQHASEKRHARPFDQYIVDAVGELREKAGAWSAEQVPPPRDPAVAYLAEYPDEQLEWMLSMVNDEQQSIQFASLRQELDTRTVLDSYLSSERGQWSEAKLGEFNFHLSGKVFIPQPFATLRNAYEPQSGFGISRYMIIEVVVAIIMVLMFRWVAGVIKGGNAPKGKLANLLESFLVFIKTDIVEKGIDPHDSAKFMPLMWTIFLFILGCNLMGMLPWVGSPTAALGVTAILALIVFGVGTVLGVRKFGAAGYLKSLCPEFGLPIYLAIAVVPMVWVIEFFSLFIKHAILAIRLMSNMVSGHLVLLGILGLAFGAHAAEMGTFTWSALSIISILGTTLLSFMELFVAFLQAYVFTLLASLFIGTATHGH